MKNEQRCVVGGEALAHLAYGTGPLQTEAVTRITVYGTSPFSVEGQTPFEALIFSPHGETLTKSKAPIMTMGYCRSSLSSWHLFLFVSIIHQCEMHDSGVGAFSLFSASLRGGMACSQHTPSCHRSATTHLLSSSSDEIENQALESLRSLVDFHEGSWNGRATSFSVTADVAAGIVQRRVSSDYVTDVKLGMIDGQREYAMTETLQWDDKIVSRSSPLLSCNMDVDSVDASYSLDSSLMDLPADIIGTDKLIGFGVEHCLAASDNKRVRCFALYGVDQSLARIVLCDETRNVALDSTPSNSDSEGDGDGAVTAQDLFEINQDIDRIVDKISGQISSEPDSSTPNSSTASDNTKNSPPPDRLEQLQQALSQTSSNDQEDDLGLEQHNINLLELSSGIWLGDTMIRDMADLPLSPFDAGKGFSGKATPKPKVKGDDSFAAWDVGVQKVACRFQWDFGDTVQQVNDFGRGMGAETAKTYPRGISGTIYVNEGLSRRIPVDQRMVYIDYDNGDYVGFLLGSNYVQVPRFVSFNPAAMKETKPFFTEFSVYQSNKGNQDSTAEIISPEVCCSKIMRLYNSDGELKQGCTSFYTLNQVDI